MAHTAKVNLLNKINDAASQFGGLNNEQQFRKSAYRDIGAKSTAQSIMGGNSLKKKDLEVLGRDH